MPDPRSPARTPDRGEASRAVVALVWVLAGASLVVAAAVFAPIVGTSWAQEAQLDLTSVVHAVAELLSGASLYAVSPEDAARGLVPFVYPPAGAFPYVPLTLVPDRAAMVIWMVAEAAAMAWAINLSFRRALDRLDVRLRLPVLVAVVALATSLLFPLRFHVAMGQLGIFLMCAVLADAVPARTPWPRGLLVGLATAVKLVPAVFIVYFLVTRQFRAAVASLVTLAAAWGLAWLVFPVATAEFFPEGVVSRMSVEFDIGRFDNMSARSILARWVPGAPSWMWLLAAGVIVAACLLLARGLHRRGEPLAAVTVIGLASLFASPISWSHHIVWLIPAAGVILGSAAVPWRRVAAVALLVPFVLPPDSLETSPFAAEGYSVGGIVYTFVNDRYAIAALVAISLIVLVSATMRSSGMRAKSSIGTA